MSLLCGEPFVEVTRDGIVESVHCIAACAVDATGRELLSMGSTDCPVYLRSTAKPFIASAIVSVGVLERFGLEPHEIATIASSHNGESFHLTAVRSILDKIGMDESYLQCGPEGAGYPQEPIYNNCSGKHAGVLALCRHIGSDPRTYLDPRNAAQQLILDVCARVSCESIESLHVGVDGCGIPAYATSLRNAAHSYMQFATGQGLNSIHSAALRTVGDAMLTYPEYASGTGEFDAALTRAGGGNIVCKGGAEGVCGVAMLNRGIGLVLKVADGSSRARSPAVLAALSALHMLSPEQVDRLSVFARTPVRNKAGRLVGEIRGVSA